MTSVLFVLGKFVIGFYLGHAAVASPYGRPPRWSVILMWVYYSAQILYLGAESTKIWMWRRSRPIGGR